MHVDMNEVVTQLGGAEAPLGDTALSTARDGNAEIVAQLKRIDNATRLIAVVVVAPIVVSVVAVAATVIAVAAGAKPDDVRGFLSKLKPSSSGA